MKVIKIGLIGCGTVTIKAHIPALMNDPTARISAHNFQITAICGLDPANLETIKSLLLQAEVFLDHRDLLAKADCEAVLIATGEEQHPLICRHALEAGKFVLCEKPLGVNVPAIEAELGDLEAKQKNRLQIAFNKRFHPVYLKYRELRANGDFGTPVCGHFYFCTQQGKKPGWDGALSNLIHYCDLVSSIFGDIVEVRSLSGSISNGLTVSAALRSRDGAVASLLFTSAASWSASLHEEWQLVDNERNRIVSRNCAETYLFRHEEESIHTSNSNSIFWLRDAGGYKTQLSSFYDLASGAREIPDVGLDDALRAHALFDLIRAQNEK
ncbi:MAG TPA: Gfo/Idh/MocA family oxidoreductase [Candidatus Syntrophosphaera sp.]|nr:Gfo/Idh/MocA family oxidoreductase [Candidatus Syntrophosphaera sp.]